MTPASVPPFAEYAAIGGDTLDIDDSTVDDNIIATGLITIDGSTIAGTIGAAGLEVDGTTVEGTVRVDEDTNNDIQIGDPDIEGNLHTVAGNQELAIDDSTIEGTVTVSGDVDIDGTEIEGDLVVHDGSGSTHVNCDDVTIEGEFVVENESELSIASECPPGAEDDRAEPEPPGSVPTFDSIEIPAVPTGDDDDTDQLSDAAVKVEEGESKTIETGQYVLEDITVEEGAELEFDTQTGAIEIWYGATGDDNLEIKEGGTITVDDGGEGHSVSTYMNGSSSLDADIQGTVQIEPEADRAGLFEIVLDEQQQADIDIGDGESFTGLVFAVDTNHDIDVDGDLDGAVYMRDGQVDINGDIGPGFDEQAIEEEYSTGNQPSTQPMSGSTNSTTNCRHN